MPDHVHMLVSAPPRLSPARIAQIFKSITARELFKQFPDLKKHYWGGLLWTDSYFVETVGTKRLDAVKDYIRNQKQMTMDLWNPRSKLRGDSMLDDFWFRKSIKLSDKRKRVSSNIKDYQFIIDLHVNRQFGFPIYYINIVTRRPC